MTTIKDEVTVALKHVGEGTSKTVGLYLGRRSPSQRSAVSTALVQLVDCGYARQTNELKSSRLFCLTQRGQQRALQLQRIGVKGWSPVGIASGIIPHIPIIFDLVQQLEVATIPELQQLDELKGTKQKKIDEAARELAYTGKLKRYRSNGNLHYVLPGSKAHQRFIEEEASEAILPRARTGPDADFELQPEPEPEPEPEPSEQLELEPEPEEPEEPEYVVDEPIPEPERRQIVYVVVPYTRRTGDAERTYNVHSMRGFSNNAAAEAWQESFPNHFGSAAEIHLVRVSTEEVKETSVWFCTNCRHTEVITDAPGSVQDYECPECTAIMECLKRETVME